MAPEPPVANAAGAAARPPRQRRSWRMFWRVFAAMVATIVVGSWSFGSLFGVYQDRATAAALAPLWAEVVRSDAAASAATRRVEIAIGVRAGDPPTRAVDLGGDPRMKAMARELGARGIVVRAMRLDDSLDPPVTWLRIDRGGGASAWIGIDGGLQPSGYGRRLGLGLLALVLIALAVAAAMSRWVASPLARLVDQIDGIARGEAPQARVRGAREIERLGDALRAMADQRFADDQRLRTMLLGVSHDLRSPLARIRVAADLLDDGAPALREAIVSNVGQADAIIDSFLAYVRAEEESADENVDLADLARRAAEDARLAFAPDAAPVRVRGNATMLRRLVANLIDNAERHGAAPVTVEVVVDAAASEAVLRVADHGRGLADPARLRRAFERGDAARGTQGAGLGLAIVDRIAERHGGRVDIGSADGGGAVITVRLPLAGPLPVSTAPR